VFFYEGFETTFHFKVALAVLQLNEETIMQCDDGIMLVTLLKKTFVQTEDLIKVLFIILFYVIFISSVSIVMLHVY